MDRLETMRVFVTVAREQSFASAARRLRMSPAGVTRAVRALEEHLGARLLHRTSRQVRLTDVGTRYLADSQRILSEIEEADALAAGAQAEARGELSITAPMMFGRLHVAPVLLEFLSRHRQLTARALFVDHLVDLLEERLDVALRIGSLNDSSLHAVRVGKLRRVLCASPEYLRARGVPATPEALATHDLIAFSGIHSHRHWAFRQCDTLKSIGTLTPRLVVNTADTAIAAAVAGFGLTRVLSYQVERELRTGQLQLVLADHEPPATPVHLVHAERRKSPARLRFFMDFAVPRLRSVLTQIDAGLDEA